MIVEVLKWWWASGCILLMLVLLHPRAHDLADLEGLPELQKLPKWLLISLFWAIAMFTSLLWPVLLVRTIRRARK